MKHESQFRKPRPSKPEADSLDVDNIANKPEKKRLQPSNTPTKSTIGQKEKDKLNPLDKKTSVVNVPMNRYERDLLARVAEKFNEKSKHRVSSRSYAREALTQALEIKAKELGI